MKSDLAMKLLDPGLPDRLGRIRHVLFDFDGTLSVLREGWEGVMVPMMLEMISPEGARLGEIEPEVCAYVDRSTGILTIRQMEWLAGAYFFGARYIPTIPATVFTRWLCYFG